MNEETWKDIQGYEGLYQISNFGRVKSFHGRKNKSDIRKQPISKTGYHVVFLKKDKKQKTVKVHRLMAIAFIANPNNLPIVNHINGIPTDNRIGNLEWCDQLHNVREAFRIGLVPKSLGTNTSNCKLTPEKVKEIYLSKTPWKKLAKDYGIGESTVWSIKSQRTWKQVTSALL